MWYNIYNCVLNATKLCFKQCYNSKGLKNLIYLDNCATTRPCDEAIKAVCENMSENFGNPSSLHKAGIEAEKVLKSAKKTI